MTQVGPRYGGDGCWPIPTTAWTSTPPAQCVITFRAVVTERVTETMGNVGGAVLTRIRETIAVLLDL